ncbi:MAG: hypothetical protein WC865_11320 [Bacteroidales bacterium]
MKPIDIVYVLGTGSGWSDNEIRFSLRSVFKNLTNIGQIFIVGEKPAGLKGFIHIDHPDEFSSINADANIIRKVLRACQDPRVSEKFLFINDDHIIMKPMRADRMPPFHKGDMKSFHLDYFSFNEWRKRLYKTMIALEEQNLPTLHFDCHTPIIFEKEKFIEAMSRFDYASGIGLCMKSLYGNIYYPDAPCLAEQKKTVFKSYTLDELNLRFEKPILLSFNDQGLNDSLKIFLYQNFSLPSPLETCILEDRIIEIYRASRESFSYELARDTYLKHFKNNNMKAVFISDRANRFENKLKYLLEQKLTGL